MFFGGEAASRRKVELRGRSAKESDREALLKTTKDERERRMLTRLKNTCALRIQKCFRGKREVAANKQIVREEFRQYFGDAGFKTAFSILFACRGDAFNPQSKYLASFFYFFKCPEDVPLLLGVCRLFVNVLAENGGNVTAVFTTGVYDGADRGAINYRVRRLAGICLDVLHYHRFTLRNDLLRNMSDHGTTMAVLVETVVQLVRHDTPWAVTVLEHLVHNNMLSHIRDLLLVAEVNAAAANSGEFSLLENLVYQLYLQLIRQAENLRHLRLSSSFIAQIFSVPLLWLRLPLLKQASVTGGLWAFAVHEVAVSLPELKASLPPDEDYPSSACLLGNILEASVLALPQSGCNLELAASFSIGCSYLMECLPPHYLDIEHDEEDEDDDMPPVERSAELVSQLRYASHPDVLKNLVKSAFASNRDTFSPSEASAIGAITGFIYATYRLKHKSDVLMTLAYTAQITAPLWKFIKFCHLNDAWPAIHLPGFPASDCPLTPDVLGRLVPLAVFCPVFNYLLMSMDNEEFYEKQRIISMDEAVLLVHVLKEALWQVLWVMPSKSYPTTSEVFSYQSMRETFINVGARLLTELHDRNSKRQFAPPQAFHGREAIEELFFQQAEAENSKARELLKSAPFLIPFTSRVRIYTAQLAAARTLHQSPFTRTRITVQRDRIIEDSFAYIRNLSEEDMKGTIRVNFVNELGLDEAGVDGGGLFKDFMENITKAAFDIQYGLFKETADHLLYPNPASHLVHPEHLQFFEFLGRILGKAMFEGILVDIPFATFFLSKLKKKYNHLHDLPSLDPVLYKNLLFLKNNSDISQLGLYFVIGDEIYGQHDETELLPGGRDIQVTEQNVYRYIHLVANHRLNHQIRNQSSHFLRGFQQLINTDWINMFNEHELQILISGSHDTLDVDDLRSNVNYGGGYHETHPVIEMLWETLKTLDAEMQRKFLKFVTGCSRGPLLGFKYLEPKFCIQKTAPDDAADDVLDRLPTAATCMNLLKLPPYKSKTIVRDKLLYAITSGSGFDLS